MSLSDNQEKVGLKIALTILGDKQEPEITRKK